MECAVCSRSSADPDFVFETKHWKIFLRDDQAYLGRCVVGLKRHCGSLGELSVAEWEDFGLVAAKLEKSLKKAFGAAMFNWTCMVNDAYKKPAPDPHIHWHLRPRYDRSVNFAGVVFTDTEFGHHYNRERSAVAPSAVRKEIVEKVKKSL